MLPLAYTFCFIDWRMNISNVEWHTENTVQLIELIRINKSVPKI